MIKIYNKISKIIMSLAILMVMPNVHASPITFAFSGEVSWDYYDVPVGTVLWGSFTYDSTASLVDIGLGRKGYNIDMFELNIGGESATNIGGTIRISGSDIIFDSGPSTAFGGGNEFSSLISGIDVRGFGLTLTGLDVPDVLPNDPATFYDMTGEFFINRSGGSVYDVNSIANLLMPPVASGPVTVPEPDTVWLLVMGLIPFGFGLRRRYYARGLRKDKKHA